MSNKITCTCGHSWNKSSSSKKDATICHICGKDITMKNGGWLDAYDEEMQLGGNVYPVNYVPQAENGIEGTMGGLTDKGFNYNGAWGGPSMQFGGNLPGAVGSMYARMGAPSKGPRRNQTDVTDASAQNGKEMSFYQNGLDWTPRNISKNGSEIPQAQDGEEVTLEDLLKVVNKKPVYDNIPHPSVLKAKAETDIKAKQQAAVNAQRYKQGEIKNIPKQNIIDKTKSAINKGLSIAAHPMTAAAYLAKGQRIPDNFEKGNLNSYDFATSILNPASVAYSAGQIPGNIEDGDYGQALFNTMGALPALGMVPAAMKKVNPLLYDINKQLIANKDYGKIAAINLMSAADAAGPMIMKTPGLKSLYKKAAYNAASTSGGNTSMSPGEAFRNILFPRLGEKNKYLGSMGKKAPDRDLVRQYIYGDAPGFENIDIKPYGLEKYVDKYGDMEVFKMNSEIPHGQPLSVETNTSFAKKFREAMNDSGGDEAATQRGYVTVPLTSKANPVLPIDDVAGHTVRVSNTGSADDYMLTSQDIWKFDPDDYLKRWGMGSSRSGGMRPDDYQLYLQAKLLERAGKPFILMQENPLQWTEMASSHPYDLINKNIGNLKYKTTSLTKSIEQDLIDNPNLTKEDLYDNLINFELFTKPPVQDAKLSKSIKFKREDGGIVKDDNGYWNPENWGKPVEIGSNDITMQGVYEPLIGISDTGDVQMMYPGEDYKFDGESVTEYPIAQNGKTLPTVKVKKEPIYVDDPRDPRLRAYNDSLFLFNKNAELLKGMNDRKYTLQKREKANLNSRLISLAKSADKKLPLNYVTKNMNLKNEGNGMYSLDDYASGIIDRTLPRQYFKPGIMPQGFDVYTKNLLGLGFGDKRVAFDYSNVNPKQKVILNPPTDVPKKHQPKPQPKPQPVKKKPTPQPKPVQEQPAKQVEKPSTPVEVKKNVYEGTPAYSSPLGSGAPSALIGFVNPKGDTTYIKPEDYQRYGVPTYGKEFIESKTKKKKNGGWLDKYN